MAQKKDTPGRRTVEVEFELPGTPEQVWEAIATGPGISSWFVPTEVEPREGGAVKFYLGPDMTSSGHVTGWNPPHRFAYEEPGWNDPAPPLASEFIIEARSAGTCTVRVVHSLFTSQEDWDDQLGSMKTGWGPFFRVLAIYLTHFAGLPGATGGSTVPYPGTQPAAWDDLRSALGLSAARVGETYDTSPAGGPSLVGRVVSVTQEGRHCELTMQLDKPAPGVALLGTHEWAGKVNVAISLYFYGPEAAKTAEEQGRVWEAWLRKRFQAG